MLTTLWKNSRKWLPGVVISIVALGVVFRLASWEDLGMAFQSIRPVNVIAAVLITLVSLSTRAKAWQVLLEWKASFTQSFFIINEGYLLNNLFPLRAGEIGRAVFMGQASGLGPMHVLSTIVIERSFDVAIASGMLLSTLPLALRMDWAKPVAVTTLALVAFALLLLFLMARFHTRIQQFFHTLAGRWSFIQKHVSPRIGSFLNGLGALTHPSHFFQALFWIVMSWVLWVGTYYVLMLMIVPNAPLWWAAFVDSALALGVAIPSAPAAIGVFEATMVGSFSLLGVDASLSLGFAIFTHFFNFVTTGVLGLIGLVVERRSISTVLNPQHSTVNPSKPEKRGFLADE